MRVDELLKALNAKGIFLRVEEGMLKSKVPKGAMTPTLMEGIKANKETLIQLLTPSAEGPAATLIPKLPDHITPVISLAQQRLWFLHRLDPQSTLYNMPMTLHLKGYLDQKALDKAITCLCERHQLLRAHFIATDPLPQLSFLPAEALCLVSVDLRHVGPNGATLDRLCGQHANFRFNLSTGPLLRMTLLQLAATHFVLLVNMHHIISDGWSMSIFARELSALYSSFIAGKVNPLPPLLRNYADYAYWQRQHLQGNVLADHEQFWRQHLAEASWLLDLPTDFPYPREMTHEGADYTFHLDPDNTSRLHQLSADMSASPFMILLAAFKVLLYRYCHQNHLIVGTPLAGRNRAETENMIGFFVNSLALATNMSHGRISFNQLIETIKANLVAAFAHQDLPFEKLVEILQPQRNAARPPLFQVMFALHNDSENSLVLPGLTLEQPGSPRSHLAKYELTLTMSIRRNRLMGTFNFNQGLFRVETIANMATHFCHLLATALAHPKQQLDRLSLMDGPMLQRELLQGQGPDRSHGVGILAQMEALAAIDPQAPALWDLAQNQVQARFSRGQLQHYVHGLAAQLWERGVRPGQIVAVLAGRSATTIAAYVAILHAGAAYMPIDPGLPALRIRFMLAEAGVGVLLSADVSAASQVFDGPVLDIHPGDSQQPFQRREVAEDFPAYALFTSGSTGIPKGVLASRRAWHNTIWRAVELLGITAQDRLSCLASVAFDASVWEIWSGFYAGAPLYVVHPDLVLQPNIMQQVMLDQGISVCFQPTVLAETYMAMSWPKEISLRVMYAGGDRLKYRPPQQLPFVIFNTYGPAENSVVTSVSQVEPGETAPTIGTVLPTVSAYVADRNLHPLPPGVPGELVTSGGNLTMGYINQARLTGQCFVPNPFSQPGSRLYRTGDLVRRLPNGELAFLGRIDHQVKLRGIRLELGEIEANLCQVDGVVGAVVTLMASGNNDVLVAYLAGKGEGLVDRARAFLISRLPEYMIPSSFVHLTRFPMTANGKIDRRNLPLPNLDLDGYVAPGNDIEEQLARLFGEVLGKEKVGIHENFFTMGGHSLLATRLVARANALFLVELPLRAVFEAPTVAGLAKLLTANTVNSAPIMIKRSRDAISRPSFSQERLWFLDRLEGPSPLYHMPLSLTMKGNLSQDVLGRAIQTLWQRHEILSTAFEEHMGEPRLVFHKYDLPLQIIDLRSLDGLPCQREEATKLASRIANVPFSLQHGPLLRTCLLRLQENAFTLLINMHHIISDGWSMGIFTRELHELYHAYLRGHQNPLKPQSLQFSDYAAWQREWLKGPVLDAQLAFWRKQMAGASLLLDLPTDMAYPTRINNDGGFYPFRLEATMTSSIDRLAAATSTTPFMILLTTFKLLLYRYSYQNHIVVGTPIAGRQHAETEHMIGFFVNTLALATSFGDGQQGFISLLKSVRNTLLDAYAHQDLPFEKLVEALQPNRGSNRSPLFQVMFLLEDQPQETISLPGVSIEKAENQLSSIARFELTLMMKRNGDSLGGYFNYRTQLFHESTIGNMAAHFESLLSAVVADGHTHIDRLPMMGQAALAHQLCLACGPRLDEIRAVTLHQTIDLLEVTCGQHPALLEVGTQGVGFNEVFDRTGLRQFAENLGMHLAAHGVGNGQVVAVIAPRSARAVAAYLAALKRGIAWLPIDPATPVERISYMCREASVAALLTSREQLSTASQWFDGPLICIDDTPPARPFKSVSLCLEQLAYIIFTSGSMGQPKGVAVNHHSLHHLTRCWRELYQLKETDRATVVAGVAFDASIIETWPFLTAGTPLYIVNHETAIQAPLMQRFLLDAGITVTFQPTPLAEALLALDWPRDTVLRLMQTAGDRLTRRPTPHTPFELTNNYGPAENTVWATWHQVGPEGGLPTIGAPIPGVNAYILDPRQQPVPMGIPGELVLAGLGLANGYVARPSLTAAKFLPNPFVSALHQGCEGPGSRLYRTGDLVRRVNDREIAFLGRVDHQVKLRGMRLELGEIEQLLGRVPNVRAATVILYQSEGEAFLAAYVVGEGDNLEVNCRAALQRALPEYMVPVTIDRLVELPLTINGKLDQRALPKPRRGRNSSEPPLGEVEEMLAAIWKRLLHIDSLGRNDSFFQLGGHSLAAVRLVAAVSQQFAKTLLLSDVFQFHTLAEMAARLGHRHGQAIMIPLSQGQQSRCPLYLVHPVSGLVFCYKYFAEHLGERPIFGLQSQGLTEAPSSSIEAMAQTYLQAIQMHQPEGPYFLGGWSMGGLVAYEMAAVLHVQGIQVFLLLLDTYFNQKDHVPIEKARGLFEADLARLPGAQEAIREDAGDLERLFQIFNANVAAATNYRPSSLDVPVLFIKAADRQADGMPCCKNIRVIKETVDHYGLVSDPASKRIARAFEDWANSCSATLST